MEVGEREIARHRAEWCGKSTHKTSSPAAPARGQYRLRRTGYLHLQPYQIVERGMCYVPQVAKSSRPHRVGESRDGRFLAKTTTSRRDGTNLRIFSGLKDVASAPGKIGRRSADGGDGSALMLEPKLVLMVEPSPGFRRDWWSVFRPDPKINRRAGDPDRRAGTRSCRSRCRTGAMSG